MIRKKILKALPAFTSVVEGTVDANVVRAIFYALSIPERRIIIKGGKSAILKQLPRYNQAANHSPWLLLVDLDHDASCAPSFLKEHLGSVLHHPPGQLLFRIAVHAVEAWLLADAVHLAQFLGADPAWIPKHPDQENDPKAILVSLAKRSARKAIRQDMCPREGGGISAGPAYVSRLNEFVQGYWNPRVAAERSPSLKSCMASLERLHSALI